MKKRGQTLKGSNRREKKKMKATLTSHLTVQQLQLGQISFMPVQQQSSSVSLSNPYPFQNIIESETQATDSNLPSSSSANIDEKDFILSQDFFCTPDYITPEVPPVPNCSDYDKEQFSCPKSPEKLKTVKSKRQKHDAHELDYATEPTILSQKRRTGICIQDGAEFPVSDDDGNFVRFPRRFYTGGSDDEIISDDEKVEKAGSSSLNAVLLKANRSSKGGRGRAKSKISFHFHNHKDLASSANDEDEIPSLSNEPSLQQDLEQIQKEGPHSMSELLDLFQGKNVQHYEIDSIPADVAVERNHPKLSAAELLDSFQENNVLLGANSTKHGKTKERAQLVVRRNTYKLGDRNIGDDGSSEAFDSGSSSGDEDVHKNIKRTNSKFKQKTMTDQFHEAFGISSMNDETLFQFPRQSGIGLFGELQRVLQSEKEREIEFLRKLQTETSLTDESGCIDVRILSRCLEAKLTVCCCSFIRDKESSECLDNSKMGKDMERNSTVIFSPRTCSDVELDPGKLIRIHPPWKEINITGKDKNVILSTYFSQILT